jgi:hypothetical protein
MQIGDLLNLVVELLSILEIVFLVVGAFRSLEMRKAFVASSYRGRATWMAGFMLVLAFSNINSNIPGIPTLGIYYLSLGEIGFVAVLLIVLVFVDRNLKVLTEIDFFHRDTYKWARIRKFCFIALLGVSMMFLVYTTVFDISSNLPDSFIVVGGLYFGTAALVIGYAATALIVASRRTPDRTMRMFSRLLGVALALGVVSFTIWIIPLIGYLISSVAGVVSAYVLYRAVLSLSSLGKVEKDVQAMPRLTTRSPNIAG